MENIIKFRNLKNSDIGICEIHAMNQKNKILGIITYADADHLCKDRLQNWTNYTKPDKILFSGGDIEFWSDPDSYKISIGTDNYPNFEIEQDINFNLINRLVGTLDKCISLSDDPENAHIILIEPDVWFWDSPPQNEGFTGCRKLNTELNLKWWHWPLIICGKNNALNLLKVCKILNKYNTMTYPYGASPDRFIALAVELANIKENEGNQFSKHHLCETDIKQALNSRNNGAFAIHGIKTWTGYEELK